MCIHASFTQALFNRRKRKQENGCWKINYETHAFAPSLRAEFHATDEFIVCCYNFFTLGSVCYTFQVACS